MRHCHLGVGSSARITQQPGPNEFKPESYIENQSACTIELETQSQRVAMGAGTQTRRIRGRT